MKFDISKEEIINQIVADTIMKIITTNPTDSAEMTTPSAEKTVAWIEVYDDVLDEAYEMSKEIKEYE